MIALWMIYATIVATILGVGAALFERAASRGLRQHRWVWLLALVLSVAIPLVTIFLPNPGRALAAPNDTVGQGVDRRASGIVKASTGLAELIARADTRSLRRLDSPLAIAWSAAAMLALIAYGAATWLLVRRRRTWRRTLLDGQSVLLAPATGPAVIGTLRPQIVVPEWSLALSTEQRALMIAHERQHVRAKDPLVLHVAAMVALLMPWNIAAWWLNRRLRLAVELDCDARVLAGGGDARAYGMLLLDVCSRRPGAGLVLSPALFDRTSSLTTRILAMQPAHLRFPRTRVALGVAIGLAITIIACEMPTPEMVAPDGKDAASKRLYGEMKVALTARQAEAPAQIRATVTQYFPAIARGDGGPSILFVVKSSAGKIVLTESQPAAMARVPQMKHDTATVTLRESRPSELREPMTTTAGVVLRQRTPEPGRVSTPNLMMPMKVRQPGATVSLPAGVGALRPDDIATIDITKHAAGAVAPNAVSIISIVLKPGAVVPTSAPTP